MDTKDRKSICAPITPLGTADKIKNLTGLGFFSGSLEKKIPNASTADTLEFYLSRVSEPKNKHTKLQKEKNKMISTLLVYLTLPLSGFAIDVYLPSFPGLLEDLNTSMPLLQMTITVFLLSYGISQFFMGSVVDSFGRYKIGIAVLFLFALSSFAIAGITNIQIIIAIRAVQGFLIATMMICQRSFLVDLHKDEPLKLKKYTSLVSIVWSAAPIIAPFAGGYLQYYLGWQSNFYFLAIYALLAMVLHLVFSGEALNDFKPFRFHYIKKAYKEMLITKDFVLGVVFLGTSFTMVILFGMSIPFIAEHKYHFTSKISGNMALLSGIAILLGGMFARYHIQKNFIRKISYSIFAQIAVAVLMLLAGWFTDSLLGIMPFVILLHFGGGFQYNVYFTYCLTRFTGFAGLSTGFISGGAYIITSFWVFLILQFLVVDSQVNMAVYYIVITLLLLLILVLVLPSLLLLQKRNK